MKRKTKIVITIIAILLTFGIVSISLEFLAPKEFKFSSYANRMMNKNNQPHPIDKSGKQSETSNNSSNITGKSNNSTSLVAVRSSLCKKEYDEQTSFNNGNQISESVIYLDQFYDFVLVNCTQSAYQGIYNLNIKNRKNGIYTLLELENYSSESKSLSKSTEFCQRASLVRNYEYLEVVCHGRGLGDCGTQDLYKWIPDQLTLRLAKAREQKDCILDILENQKLSDKDQKALLSKPFPIIYENTAFL